MSFEQYVLEELRAIRLIAESIALIENRMLKIPAASKKLGIGQAKVRQLCKDGIIPCTRLNGKKRPQYLVDTVGALNVLSRGGYLVKPQNSCKARTKIDLSK